MLKMNILFGMLWLKHRYLHHPAYTTAYIKVGIYRQSIYRSLLLMYSFIKFSLLELFLGKSSSPLISSGGGALD